METEIKLLINPSDIESLIAHQALKQYGSELPRSSNLESTYFDTAELFFKRHRASLRVRHIVGEGWVQTLKESNAPSSGLHQRQEWETVATGEYPDLRAIAELVKDEPRWAKLFTPKLLKKKLVPLFTTHIKRTTWMVRLDTGSAMEVALDQGTVESGRAEEPVNEVELELKTGQPSQLFDFATALQRSVPMQLGNQSKYERGLALCVPQPPGLVNASRFGLSRDMSVEQGFQEILRNCLIHIEGNVEGVIRSRDVESVHQMRVGLRRMHSALALFEDLAPCPRELLSEFKWLGSELGAVRDWEVLAEHTLPGLEEVLVKTQEQVKFQQLQSAAHKMALAKRIAVAQVLTSPRYAELMLGFRRWTSDCRWREVAPRLQLDGLASPLKPFADATCRNKYRKLLKRGNGIAKLDPESRHGARIAAKRVRYATEFFESLYRTAKVKPFTKTLSSLQNVLGRLNDANVAGQLLDDLRKQRPDLCSVCDFVRGYLVSQSQQELTRLAISWKRFKRASAPR